MLDLDIGILTPSSLASKDMGRAVLSLLCEFLPEFIPERCGNYEPLKHEFNLERLEEALIFWQHPFLWKKKRKPRAEGSIAIANQFEYHSAIYLSGQSRQDSSQRIVKFVHHLADLIEIDFAYIHLFGEQELDAATDDQVDEMVMPFRIGVVTHELRRYLPNLCWGTIFGSPYIQLFGRERLLSVPAPVIHELSDSMIYVQISEDLLDSKLKYNEFNSVRNSVKKHLNSNAFLDPYYGVKHSYNAPQFRLI